MWYPVNKDVKVDSSNVETIGSWPEPKTIQDIRTFHGLASLYWRFVKDLSLISAPITENSKNGLFKWTAGLNIGNDLDRREAFLQA